MILETWTPVVRKIFRARQDSRLIGLLGLNRWQVAALKEEIECEVVTPLVEQASPLVKAWWRDGSLQNLAPAASTLLSYRSFSDVLPSANRRGGFLFAESSLIVPQHRVASAGKGVFPEHRDSWHSRPSREFRSIA